jgi:hypothetical protein
MIPNDNGLDSLEEDRELEHRKPNLGEIEKDTSEV